MNRTAADFRMMTIREAARTLKVSPALLARLCREGRVASRETDGEVRISSGELDRIRAQREQMRHRLRLTR